MSQDLKLLLCTHNRGKIQEYRALMGDGPFNVISLADLGITMAVEENGATYKENASIKARAYGASSGLIALADDSGLEVDALNNAPGPLSARYAGPGAKDSKHISRLLAELMWVPWEKRTARFVCVIAIVTPSGSIAFYQGSCEGIIALEARGDSGFGYDPVFYLPTLGKTMAQLSLREKNRISHRSEAMGKALPFIARLFRNCAGT